VSKDPNLRVRCNLERATVLLVDTSPIGMAILVQIVTALGCKTVHRCTDVEKARQTATRYSIDLAIVDAMPPELDGYEFVKWLRRETPDPTCYAPVVLTAAHTPESHVHSAVNCGGDALLKKPISPIVMLERIIWAARPDRSFIISDIYVGPRRPSDGRILDPGGPGALPVDQEDTALVLEPDELRSSRWTARVRT
jgi:DNA-binding response OmpR family regulator